MLIGVAEPKVDVICPHDPKTLAAFSTAGITPDNSEATNIDGIIEVLETVTSHAHSGGVTGNILSTFSLLRGNAKGILPRGDDRQGALYAKDMGKAGVSLCPDDPVANSRTTTIYCTTNAEKERYMAYHPGNASDNLLSYWDSKQGELLLQKASMFLFEGYMWHHPQGDELFRRMCDRAAHGAKHVVLIAASADVVRKKHDAIIEFLISDTPAYFFSNAQEANALSEGSGQPPDVYIQELLQRRSNPRLPAIAFITNGADPTQIITANSITFVPVAPVDTKNIVNTIGAGDTFAAGVLRGLDANLSPNDAVSLGHALSRQVIQQEAARLENPMDYVPERFKNAISTGIRR